MNFKYLKENVVNNLCAFKGFETQVNYQEMK